MRLQSQRPWPLSERHRLAEGILSVTLILIWTMGSGCSVSRSAEISDRSNVPEDNVHVLIEDLLFGLPTFSDEYKTHKLTGDDIDDIFAPFKKLGDQSITLTASEARQLNNIAKSSGQVHQVTTERAYRLSEMQEILGVALGYYYEYGSWGPVLTSWASFLSEPHTSYVGAPSTKQLFSSLVQAFDEQIDAPGVVQGIVGMAGRNMLSLQPEQNDCSAVDTPDIRASWD